MALVEQQLHAARHQSRRHHFAAELQTPAARPPTIGALGGQANSQTFRVNSQQRWTDTGITVRAGDIITFQSSGQIQMSDNAQDVASPAGSLSRRMAPDAPISGVLAGALIAKIGGYAPMAIGDQTRITAPVSGEPVSRRERRSPAGQPR